MKLDDSHDAGASGPADWSLQRELLDVTGCLTVNEALQKIGLCARGCSECELCVEDGFTRWGSETYGLRARVAHSNGERTPFVLKACVAVGVQGVSAILQEWLRRRELICAYGDFAPRLYYVARACVWEEYVPFTFAFACAGSVAAQRHMLLYRLGRLLGTVRALGFPLVGVPEVRSRGTDAVLVDFGEDLGPPHVAETETAVDLDEYLGHLATQGVRVGPQERRAAAVGFEDGHQGATASS